MDLLVLLFLFDLVEFLLEFDEFLLTIDLLDIKTMKVDFLKFGDNEMRFSCWIVFPVRVDG